MDAKERPNALLPKLRVLESWYQGVIMDTIMNEPKKTLAATEGDKRWCS